MYVYRGHKCDHMWISAAFCLFRQTVLNQDRAFFHNLDLTVFALRLFLLSLKILENIVTILCRTKTVLAPS